MVTVQKIPDEFTLELKQRDFDHRKAMEVLELRTKDAGDKYGRLEDYKRMLVQKHFKEDKDRPRQRVQIDEACEYFVVINPD